MKAINKIVNYSHKYLGLIVFLQIILWSFSGFFMYFLDFSDLYTNLPEKKLDLNNLKVSINDVKDITKKSFSKEELLAISLKNISGEIYYNVKTSKKEFVINQNKQVIEQLPISIIKKISEENYSGKEIIKPTVELLKSSEGNYYSNTAIYKVKYNDKQGSEIYISPSNGNVLAKRKTLWGFYNTMWEFHLMKYTSNNKLNKNLLLMTALISLFVSLTGFIKFFNFSKK